MSLSVKSRILLLGMLPLLIALWFMGLVIVDDFRLMSSLKQVEPATYLNTHIASYIHEVQKERGATGVFLSSDGKKFQSELNQQRHLTDKAWQNLEQFISDHDITENNVFNQQMEQAIGLARGISALQQKVDSLSVSIKDALGQYTTHNQKWLALTRKTAELTDNVEISQMRLGYASFAKGKESTGIERAIISSVFGKDVLSSEALKKVTHLIAEEHTYFNFFKALASPEQLQFYQQKLSGSVTEDVY